MKKLESLATSLSKSEFNAFAAMIGKKERLVLEASMQGTEYAEEILLKQLASLNVRPQSLPPIKTRLYKSLLRFLTELNEEKRIDIEMNMLLAEIELLYSKGLFKSAANHLKLAYTKSKEIESVEYQLLIKNKQRRILGARLKADELNTIIEDIKVLSDSLRIESDFHVLYSQTKDLRIEIIRSRQEAHERSRKIENHPLLKENKKPKSWISKIRKLQIQALLAYCNHNYKLEWIRINEAVLLFEGRDTLKRYYILDYISIFHRLLVLSKTEKKDQYFELLDQFRQIPDLIERKTSKPIRNHVYSLAQSTEMVRAIQEGETQAGYHEYIKKRQTKQMVENQSAAMQITFLYKCAYICFLENKPGECHQFIQKILKEYSAEDRSDIYGYTLLLQIIAHEAGATYSIIGHLSQAAQRYLKKHNLFFDAEKWLLKTLKNAHKISSLPHQLQYLTQQKKDLELILENPLQKLSLAYFDSEKWISKKIEKLQNN